MKKKLLLATAISTLCLNIGAQTLATEFKQSSNGNPLSPCVFCADPTALEYEGRLYVYGSNDHQEFLANGKKGDNSYGSIKSIVVFSTDDMVNWTFHGTIDTKKLCSSWSPSAWYKGYGVSWAPSVTWRHNESTGKDEFFLYFCNSSHGVGVLTAESPIGPWKSPNKELMIHYDTPGANKQGTNANFDPGVTIDDNGVGWISFGGLGPSTIMPEAARIIKLKPSMTAVDGSAVKIHAPYHFEANELNVIGGKYVYTYCSNWANRDNAEWNAYKSEHNISVNAPGGGTMCYMVSDNPLDPDSWVYKGVYGPGVSGNNHSHLQKFQGKYYHIYHDHGSVLLDAMKSAGAVDASAGDYRSICVNQATVNESTATINPVTLNLTGVAKIKDLNPYELQQAETMTTCAGIEYENFTNIKKNTRVSTLGNDASQNMQVKMKASSWIMVRNVNFGNEGATSFTVYAMGTGKMEVRLGRKGGKAKATVDISSTEMVPITVDVDPADFTGVKSVYLVCTEADNLQFDAWQFGEAANGIDSQVQSGTATNREYFGLDGRRLSGRQQGTGLIIEKVTDAQGTHIHKQIRR